MDHQGDACREKVSARTCVFVRARVRARVCVCVCFVTRVSCMRI